MTSGSPDPGANVQQWTCNGSAAQAWRIVNVGQGTYTVVNKGSQLCLDVAGGSTEAGANVQQWTCNELAPQIWALQSRG